MCGTWIFSEPSALCCMIDLVAFYVISFGVTCSPWCSLF